MFDFTLTDLKSDIRKILKTQLRTTAIFYGHDAVNRMFFSKKELTEHDSDLLWGDLKVFENKIDLDDSILAEELIDLFKYTTNVSSLEFWFDSSDGELFFAPIRRALPKTDEEGNVPDFLAPESPVIKLLNFADAAVKAGDVFKELGSVAPLMSVSELAGLTNMRDQTIRNALSSNKVKLSPLKSSDGQTCIAFDEAIEWRCKRRSFVPLKTNMTAVSASRHISIEGSNGRSCPVYILGLYWNIGHKKAIAESLGLSESFVQELLNSQKTDDKYLLAKIGMAIGVDDVDEFVELVIKDKERKT